MGAFFSAILAKISSFAAWIGKLSVSVFVALWDLFIDFVSLIFSQFMDICISLLSSLNLDVFTSAISSSGSLPAELINILGLLGLPTAISIITAAIGIRLLLQLIPFVRLGS